MSEQEKTQNTTPETLDTPDTTAPKVRKPYHGVRIEWVEYPKDFDPFNPCVDPESDFTSASGSEGDAKQENPYKCPF